MARIAGVDLPRDKRVEIGLTYIYGIGRTRRPCRVGDYSRVISIVIIVIGIRFF